MRIKPLTMPRLGFDATRHESCLYLAQVTNHQAISMLFSNFTWTTRDASNMEEQEILRIWLGPHDNCFVTLFLFCVMRVSALTLLCAGKGGGRGRNSFLCHTKALTLMSRGVLCDGANLTVLPLRFSSGCPRWRRRCRCPLVSLCRSSP